MKHFYLIILSLFVGLSISNAQSTAVRGTIRNEASQAIIGASISIKGSTIGTSSNLKGEFTLNAPNDRSILVVTYLGHQTLELPVISGERMDITLKPDDHVIDAVVVTGMTSTDKRLFSGASDRIAASDALLSGVADISRSLEGRSAGVIVQNVSGTFGTAPKIQVRGATSILGSSKPLWVVDGVIMEDVTDISSDALSSGDAITVIGSAIAGLNADDIESFDILKDGSATSIYGARAMAGVIVVTTKRGQAGSAKINYSADFSMRLTPNYRNFDIMNSQDQMGVYQELERKGWLKYASVYRGQQSGIYGQMYRLIHEYDATSGQFGLPNTTEAKNGFLRNAEMRNTDWFKQLFKNSLVQTHSISVSQGSDRANSYVSASAMYDPGWHIKSSVERYTLNANTQFKVLPNLTVGILGNGSYRKQEAPGTIAQSMDAVGGEVSRDFDINPYSYALNTSRTMAPNDTYINNYTGFNIFQELDQNHIEYDIVDVRFQGEIKWRAIPSLEFAVIGAAKYNSSSMQHHIKDQSNYARAYREMSDATIRESNPWLYDDPEIPNALPISILPNGGFYEKREFKMKSYDFRASVTYNKILNNTHSLYAYGGMELNSVSRTNDWFKGVGMQYEKGEQPFFSHFAFKKYREGNNDYFSLDNTIGRNVSFFGTATYGYKNRYTATGTVRYEGSNRLGRSRQARWLPTWNISGAWNVHEENFFSALTPALSYLKLRLSYSMNADTGPKWVSNSLAVFGNYNPWRPGATSGETGLQIVDLENSELTYEKKKEFNIGLDFAFLNNRISIVTDFYTRNMYDQIGIVTTEGSGGQINKYANAAKFKAHGIEATISSRNIITEKFRWSTNLTFSYNKNEITDIKTQNNLLNFVEGRGFAMKGSPIGSLFSIPFTGLDSEGLPTFKFLDKKITAANADKLDFQERDDLGFLKYEGSVIPPITGGFGNEFTYANFRLNIFMTYAFGNVVRLDPVFQSRYSDMDAFSKVFNNRWMEAGDEAHTNIPTILSARQVQQYGGPNFVDKLYNAYNYSDERMASGSFIRMKEISLTYDFPKKLVNSWKMQNLSLKMMVTNPFLIYSDKKLNGQDPEFFRAGGVAVPMAQQFTLTLRIGF